MHNVASSKNGSPSPRRRAPRRVKVATPTLRRAQLVDAVQISALVNQYAAERLLLPRTAELIALALDDYVVAVDAGGRVMACAALDEYSPSVAEIASVAVARSLHGHRLGSKVVLAAESVARARGFECVFAMSLAERFFRSLGYRVVPLADYPEKQQRYERLEASGVSIVAKRCFRKTLK